MLNEFIPLVSIDDPNKYKIITKHLCNMKELIFHNFIPLTTKMFIAWLSTKDAWPCFSKYGSHKQIYDKLQLSIKVKHTTIICCIEDNSDYQFTYITNHLGQRINLEDPPPYFTEMFANHNTIFLHNYFMLVLNSVKLEDHFKIIDSKNDMISFERGRAKMIKTLVIESDNNRKCADIRDIYEITIENIKKSFYEYETSVVYTSNSKVDNSYVIKSNNEDILICKIECEYKIVTIEEWYKPGNGGYISSKSSWNNNTLCGKN